MTKDRLQEMKKIMEGQETQDGCEDQAAEKSTLIAFFELARSIKGEIESLKNKVNDLKTLLNDNQQWNTTATRKELERRIEEQKLVIGNLAKTIRTNLKSMKVTPVDSKRASVIQRIKDVQINSTINELNEILQDYLQCLVQHRDRSLKIFTDMLEVKGEKVDDIDSLLEEGKIAIFTNNLLIGDIEEKYNLREAEERHKGIMKIETSILEIRNLFNELALIVDLQGDKIMQVEKLADVNVNKVESGKKKLTSAAKKKRKYRNRKLYMVVICSVIIITVVVVVSLL